MAGFSFEDDSTESEDLGLDDVPVQAGPAPKKAPSNTQEIVDDLYQPEVDESQETSDSELDDQMLAVERRLAVAQYYRLVLDNSLFAGDTSPEAQQVDREVRGFVRDRMKVLMGVQPEKVAKPAEEVFSTLEVSILKQIAALAAKRTTPTTPALTPVTPPKPVEPVAAKPTPALKPVVTPVSKPQKPAKSPKQPQAPKPQQTLSAKPGSMDPATDPRLPDNYRKDPTLVAKNGRWWVQCKNADEEPMWTQNPQSKKLEPLLKDVTMMARPVGVQMVQQPNSDGFNMLMQQHGDAMISAKEKQLSKKNASGLFGATIVGNIQPGGGVPSGDDY